VDGTSLNTYAYNIESWTGRSGIPDLLGENIPRPYGYGEQFIPMTFGGRTEQLSMWVVGCNADGTMPSPGTTQRAQFNANLETIKSLFFGNIETTLALTRYVSMPSGLREQRALGQARGMTDPTTMAGATRGAFTVDLRVLSGFWTGTADQTATLTAGSNSVTNDGTAPAVPHILKFTGPLTNPSLTNTRTGAVITFTGSIGNGVEYELNCATFDASNGAVWTGLSHSGSRWLFNLAAGVQSILMTGSGAGSVTLTWRPIYL
jgi:hypothetical protein